MACRDPVAACPPTKNLPPGSRPRPKNSWGVEVSIGSAHWALLPKPVVVVNEFRTRQAQPVVIRQLSAHPTVRALLQRKLAFERIDIDDAVFPRNSVRAFHAKLGASEPDAGDGVTLEYFYFRNLTSVRYSGIAVAFDGEIGFAPHWHPRHAELRRPGINPTFTLSLTRGKDHDDQTALQELSGQIDTQKDTQNTDEGMRVTYSGIKAHAGKYTATGEATVYRRQIEASGNLELVEGAIGVPFTVSGPADTPKAWVPPGFFAGAAIGTAVLPGIGTVIGACIGGALCRIFAGGVQKPVAPAPVAPKRRVNHSGG